MRRRALLTAIPALALAACGEKTPALTPPSPLDAATAALEKGSFSFQLDVFGSELLAIAASGGERIGSALVWNEIIDGVPATMRLDGPDAWLSGAYALSGEWEGIGHWRGETSVRATLADYSVARVVTTLITLAGELTELEEGRYGGTFAWSDLADQDPGRALVVAGAVNSGTTDGELRLMIADGVLTRVNVLTRRGDALAIVFTNWGSEVTPKPAEPFVELTENPFEV